MTTAERVNQWIDEQMEMGKTREDLHNTHFVLDPTTVAILKKNRGKGFDLKILMPPHVVDFTEELIRQEPRKVNDMAMIKRLCWHWHCHSRLENNNPPFSFESFTTAAKRDLYLEYIREDRIDCEEFGGKERALAIVEKWFSTDRKEG